jgi:hypothetical protein
MKRIILFFALIFTFVISIYPYTNEYLYLKNGTIINGKIIEIKPDEYVKLEQPGGIIVIVKYADILKFNNQAPIVENNKYDSVSGSEKLRFLLVDIGFLVGTVENQTKAPLSFIAVLDLPVTNKLFMGLGAGLEFYHQTYIPIVADIRYKPANKGLAYYLQSGITLPINRNGSDNNAKYYYYNGFFINPGFSYTFVQKNETAFTLSIGYRYQITTRKQLERYYNDNYTLSDELNRFVIRFGYTFK